MIASFSLCVTEERFHLFEVFKSENLSTSMTSISLSKARGWNVLVSQKVISMCTEKIIGGHDQRHVQDMELDSSD